MPLSLKWAKFGTFLKRLSGSFGEINFLSANLTLARDDCCILTGGAKKSRYPLMNMIQKMSSVSRCHIDVIKLLDYLMVNKYN